MRKEEAPELVFQSLKMILFQLALAKPSFRNGCCATCMGQVEARPGPIQGLRHFLGRAKQTSALLFEWVFFEEVTCLSDSIQNFTITLVKFD